MSCCGKKRADLAGPAPERERMAPAPPVVDRPARVFEYTGAGTLTLNGAASGATYRFEGRGAKVEVAYPDSFGMMAEPELRPAR